MKNPPERSPLPPTRITPGTTAAVWPEKFPHPAAVDRRRMPPAEEAPAPAPTTPPARGEPAAAAVPAAGLPARLQRRPARARPRRLGAPPPPALPNLLNRDRVMDLFHNCIKLASEDKINQKNTWELGLIDHLSEIQAGEDGDDETNFQKASCTLEAGVKIYSLRVDSVHSEAYKVIGGINRAGRGEEDFDEYSVEIPQGPIVDERLDKIVKSLVGQNGVFNNKCLGRPRIGSIRKLKNDPLENNDEFSPSGPWDNNSMCGDPVDEGNACSDIKEPVNLINKPGQVNKIDIQYDKVSRQVDVHALKEVLWNHIHTSAETEDLNDPLENNDEFSPSGPWDDNSICGDPIDEVNKIDIQYDKVSRQVDVHALKEVLWNHIHTSAETEDLNDPLENNDEFSPSGPWDDNSICGDPIDEVDADRKISPASTLESSFEAHNVKKFDGKRASCCITLECHVLFDSFEAPDKCILSDMQTENSEVIDLSFAKENGISPTLRDILLSLMKKNQRPSHGASAGQMPVMEDQAIDNNCADKNDNMLPDSGTWDFGGCDDHEVAYDENCNLMDSNLNKLSRDFDEYSVEIPQGPIVDERLDKIVKSLVAQNGLFNNKCLGRPRIGSIRKLK
ncbi:hypothetical protein ACP4OV_011611, partial [Aristida adscensionis]